MLVCHEEALMKTYMVSAQPSSRNVETSGTIAAGTESK